MMVGYDSYQTMASSADLVCVGGSGCSSLCRQIFVSHALFLTLKCAHLCEQQCITFHHAAKRKKTNRKIIIEMAWKYSLMNHTENSVLYESHYQT